jgi:hypothetical protein
MMVVTQVLERESMEPLGGEGMLLTTMLGAAHTEILAITTITVTISIRATVANTLLLVVIMTILRRSISSTTEISIPHRPISNRISTKARIIHLNREGADSVIEVSY